MTACAAAPLGARLAIGFGVSSVVVALIGPMVKEAGFPLMLMVLAGVAFLGFCAISMLPGERDMSQASAEARRVTESSMARTLQAFNSG